MCKIETGHGNRIALGSLRIGLSCDGALQAGRTLRPDQFLAINEEGWSAVYAQRIGQRDVLLDGSFVIAAFQSFLEERQVEMKLAGIVEQVGQL